MRSCLTALSKKPRRRRSALPLGGIWPPLHHEMPTSNRSAVLVPSMIESSSSVSTHLAYSSNLPLDRIEAGPLESNGCPWEQGKTTPLPYQTRRNTWSSSKDQMTLCTLRIGLWEGGMLYFDRDVAKAPALIQKQCSDRIALDVLCTCHGVCECYFRHGLGGCYEGVRIR